MSRDDGFAVADMDSAYFDDAKMRDLWQRVQDPDRMARAVILHAATLLGSWRQGERITVSQASPLWMPHDDALVDELKAVKMLDRAGKIPVGPWTKWFGVAESRREVAREKGRRGGVASGKSRSSTGEAEVQPESSTGEARVNPSVPTVRPSAPPGPTVRPPPRAARGRRNGLKAVDTTTSEDAIKWLNQQYADHRITADEYHEQLKALGAA